MSLKNLVDFGSDDCSTILGDKDGVGQKLKLLNPSLVHFHCPAHRLQLAILDIIDKVHLLINNTLIVG